MESKLVDGNFFSVSTSILFWMYILHATRLEKGYYEKCCPSNSNGSMWDRDKLRQYKNAILIFKNVILLNNKV